MRHLPKLVRDDIPRQIRLRGGNPRFRRLEEHELQPWLTRKLIEEASELQKDFCLEELADVFEVVLALGASLGLTLGELQRARREKKSRCGGFEDRVLLLDIEEG